jgi:hypothetical protein
MLVIIAGDGITFLPLCSQLLEIMSSAFAASTLQGTCHLTFLPKHIRHLTTNTTSALAPTCFVTSICWC